MGTGAGQAVPIKRLVLVVATAVLVLAPGAAMASRIDNATDESVPGHPDYGASTVYVWFDCGHSCGNYFEIGAGTHVSRPGKGGYVQACNMGEGAYEREDGRSYVSAHGQARVKYKTHVETMGQQEIDDGAPPEVTVADTGTVIWDIYDGNDRYTGSNKHDLFPVDNYKTKWCWSGSP